MTTPPSGPVSFAALPAASAGPLHAGHGPYPVHLAAKRLGAGRAALVLAALGRAKVRAVLAHRAALARQRARCLGHGHLQPVVAACS